MHAMTTMTMYAVAVLQFVFKKMGQTCARAWVRVGALFELASRESGLIFYNGKIEDPSFAQPLYVSLFQQQDGSYNVVWSRPSRRRASSPDHCALRP
jgi:hypothetical protein